MRTEMTLSQSASAALQEAAASGCGQQPASAADHPQRSQQPDACWRYDAAGALERAVAQLQLLERARGSWHAECHVELPQCNDIRKTGVVPRHLRLAYIPISFYRSFSFEAWQDTCSD